MKTNSFYFIANPNGIPQPLAPLFGMLLLCGLGIAIHHFKKKQQVNIGGR
ncbi:hypothetical protein [Cohnella mopanensis]|nr:hypothetical protein [Cohnella mopanensis]